MLLNFSSYYYLVGQVKAEPLDEADDVPDLPVDAAEDDGDGAWLDQPPLVNVVVCT